ncbi:hypothetical protein KP003_16740 [Geomonas nitrogeniifigens]|uniref:hypothetical protein n=1 Tax=Geomonas diazotrophica TaxID=2843197 RepID=UPI001C2B785E|nr:hypothetical protein [Geomonas nitrogeniifigens]QXE85989.1 hypothetical protein KP003_16740 [Geomonas nitrogeniifigens]
MARSRNIKPGFFKNEHLSELPPLTRLLFMALWCEADREGRLEERPRRLAAEYFAYDAPGEHGVSTMLAQLEHSAGNFIVRYSDGNNRYIQILNFNKHQNPHKKEAPSTIPTVAQCTINCLENKESGASTIPASCKHRACLMLAGLIPDSGFLIPDSPSPITEGSKMTRKEFADLYFQAFGKLMPGILNNDSNECCQKYPAEQIREAFRIGGENGAGSFSYIKAVLDGKGKRDDMAWLDDLPTGDNA